MATAAAASASSAASGREIMGANIGSAALVGNLTGRGLRSVRGPNQAVRLADKWHCQVTTARARADRAVSDIVDVMEDLVRVGDTERLGHILSLFDAVLAGQPGLPKLDAIYTADCADAEEELAQAAYRKNPCKDTAREWLRALGKESRGNEPVMAVLRGEWGL